MILDMNLSGRPCFPVCTVLAARHIPSIFLTGYTQAAIPIDYRGAALVTKPFEPTEIKEVLAHILGLPQDWPPPEHLPSSVRH